MTPYIGRLLSAQLGGEWAVKRFGRSSFCEILRARPTGRAASQGELFVKSTPAAQASLLESEADGLAALAQAACIRTPAVAGYWVDDSENLAVLAMEWLEFEPATGKRCGERLGRQLAALHSKAPAVGDGQFGWRRDNWIGGTPQRNRWSDTSGLPGWLAFLAGERLGAMAERMAGARVAPTLVDGVQRVIDALPAFFDDGHVPRASLIHGDLWSGNWAALRDGTPVIFDPAVSISDAEAELAMMELFGSPPPGFWPAYREAAPLHEGYARRRPLYQLYHLLNHVLLFGGGYVGSALAAVDRLLAPD
jgi:fructosamine-3-kinase